MTQRSLLRRSLAVSAVLHAIAAVLAWRAVGPRPVTHDAVDIELAPPPPVPEALPAEVAKPPAPPPKPAEAAAAAAQPLPGSQEEAAVAPIDAGVDAAIDAPVDAAIDARPKPKRVPRDAGADAAPDAELDAGIDAPADAMDVAADPDAGESIAAASDAGAGSGSADGIAAGSGSGSGSADVIAAGLSTGSGAPTSSGSSTGSGSGTGAAELPSTAELAAALASATNEPAVPGAPTTAGTAANLLAYFPDGHMITALIRFDRLRGTEWAAPTERLLRPMPDYQLLFGSRDANLVSKLDTLIISTPRPRDAAATTLVGKTSLGRRPLRDFLAQGSPVTWTATQSGLIGTRTGKRPPGDQRVFVSPYKGWFLLAQPGDLGPLTAAKAKANLDTVEATAAQPAWIAGIRTIERETSAGPDDPRGPALVVSVAFGGKRLKLADGLGLGITSVPKPERISLAMELVPQGWLIRGNLRFASEADALEAIASVKQLQARAADSRMLQLLVGKPIVHVIANLALVQAGPRVSYATSMSIADARALLALAAAQVDAYFASLAAPPPAPDKH